jgi:hypothetical protein
MNELMTIRSASRLKKHPAMNGKKPGPGSRKDPRLSWVDAYMHITPKIRQNKPLTRSTSILNPYLYKPWPTN